MTDPLQELHDMMAVLSDDTDRLTEIGLSEQFGRRMYIRAMFAMVEGTVYRMKQICFSEEYGSYSSFTPAESALLREETYDLDDRGKVVIKQSFLLLVKNIKFAFEAFHKYFGSANNLKIDDAGWESFLKAVKIRNRLTHPKTAIDLNVSDAEFETVRRASDWFEESTSLALNAASDITEEGTRRNKETLKQLDSIKDRLMKLVEGSPDEP